MYQLMGADLLLLLEVESHPLFALPVAGFTCKMFEEKSD